MQIVVLGFNHGFHLLSFHFSCLVCWMLSQMSYYRELFHWQWLDSFSEHLIAGTLLISIRNTIVELNYLSSKKYKGSNWDSQLQINLFMGLKLKSIFILSWLCIVKAPIARNYPPPPPTISINCKCSLSLPTEVRNSVPSNSINFISNANNPIVIPRYSSLPFSHLLPSYIERLKIYDVYFDRYNWKIIPTFR